MRRNLLILLGACLAVAFLFWLSWRSEGQGNMARTTHAPEHLEAVIASATGTVTVTHADGKIEDAKPGLTLQNGDEIWTRETAEASLEFFDGARTALWHDSKVKITSLALGFDHPSPEEWKRQVVTLELESGRIWSRILKLLDKDSSYTVTANNVIASVRGTAFNESVDGPIVQLDQFDGTLDIAGAATGTLRTGLSASLNTQQPDLTIARAQFFTPDQTRNDHWIRAQLRADADFAIRAGQIRHDAGVDEDVSTIGTEAGPFTLDAPGAEHTFEGVRIDLNGVDDRNIQEHSTYQLKAIALLQRPDGSLEQRDVTDQATWQTSDPDLATVEQGKITVNTYRGPSDSGFQITARWNDGTHEHSGEYGFIIQPPSGTAVLNTSATFMINGQPLQ